MEHREKNIFVFTHHDLLESSIELCKMKILKCIIIFRRSLNNIYKEFSSSNNQYVVGLNIRTSIYSDFKEKCYMFYNNETEYIIVYNFWFNNY